MIKKYFLGIPTPTGFETSFGEEIRTAAYTYILKGGPGTGKSTLMKRAAADRRDDEPELYYCSSDPDSLDAVIFRKTGVIIVDGTSPHVFEPIYPGAKQSIINLGKFWDESFLRSRTEDIVALSDRCAELHASVRRYLAAIHSLSGEMLSIGESAMLREKAEGYIKRLSQRLFPKTGGERGKISLKQISSVTPKGILRIDGALGDCRIFSVNDPCAAVSDFLLKGISLAAAAAGYDVTASKDPRTPGSVYGEVVIESAGAAFVSGDDPGAFKKINGMRFYDRNKLRESKKKLSFNAALKEELSGAAVEALKEAKQTHDELEKIYIEGMNFARLEDRELEG